MRSEALLLLGLQRAGWGRAQAPDPVRSAPLSHETRGCPATEAAAPTPEGVPCLQERVTCPAGRRATTPDTRVAAREMAGPTPIGATAVARADRPARSPWQSATTATTHTCPSCPMVDDGRSTCGHRRRTDGGKMGGEQGGESHLSRSAWHVQSAASCSMPSYCLSVSVTSTGSSAHDQLLRGSCELSGPVARHCRSNTDASVGGSTVARVPSVAISPAPAASQYSDAPSRASVLCSQGWRAATGWCCGCPSASLERISKRRSVPPHAKKPPSPAVCSYRTCSRTK